MNGRVGSVEESKRTMTAKANESDMWGQDPPNNGRAGSIFARRTPDIKHDAKAKVVRDDWDDDEDDGEEENEKHGNANAIVGAPKNDGAAPGPRPVGRIESEAEEDNTKIWEDANKRAPMPELIVASSSTSQVHNPPPPAALQPTLRILKRPSASPGAASPGPLSSAGPAAGSGSAPSSGATSPAPRGTLAEREAQYQEARSRIFGEKERFDANSPSRSMSTSSSSVGVIVLRDPLGPASDPEAEPVVGQDKAHEPGRPAKGFGERRRGKK